MKDNDQTNIDIFWMEKALSLAKTALDVGEIPIGSLVIKDQKLIGGACNLSISNSDPTAHAEILALRKAGEYLKNYRLPDTTIYTTVEPCTMCLGAMVHARISRLVYGALEPKTGAVVSNFKILEKFDYNHKFQVKGGVMADEAGKLIKDFFRKKRAPR
jgi:tRNA(adenine34) deaminase